MKKMNFIRIKRANWIVAMAMLALPGALMTSCSKETNPTEDVAPKGDKLVISVLGINSNDSNVSLKGKSGSSSVAKAVAGSATASIVHEFADVDIAVSVGNNLPVKQTNIAVRRMANGLAANAGLKMAEEMAAGIKYVVYIYEGNTLVASTELQSGTAGTIDGLDLTKSYKWVALSYNSEVAAPSLTPSDASIEVPENTDALYATGTVDLATDPTIGIMFDHAFSRIGVELNTIGVFGEITGTPAVSVAGLDLASGSINLLDGSVTPGATFAPSLSYADFENIDPAFNDAKIAYVYTAPTAAPNVTMMVQNLAITHVDGAVARTYFENQADIPLPFGVGTLEAGKSYHLLLNVVESPLTTNYNGNTVRWARSNLYYRNNEDAIRNYAFYATNGQTARADGYFGFGGTVPGTFATAATEGDPCALVYPAGLWKQPSNEDFDNMINSSGTLTNVLGSLLGAVIQLPGAPNATLGSNYIEYTATSPGGADAFGDEGNNLRFYFNGHINSVAALTQLGNGGGLLGLGLNDLSVSLLDQSVLDLGINVLDSYGDLTALWTHDQALNLLGLVGAGTWGYIAIPVDPLIGSNYVPARKTAELLNGVSALGIDVLSTTLKNVRCVRAN